METNNFNLVSVVLYVISAIIAFFMLYVAGGQLKKLANQVEEAVKANSISQLNALLTLEDQISQRRQKLSKVGISIKQAGPSSHDMDSLNLEFDEAKQMYLNSLDRLCFCVQKNFLPTDDIRREYKEVIKSAMNDFKDDFGPTSHYRNIKKIYEEWQEK